MFGIDITYLNDNEIVVTVSPEESWIFSKENMERLYEVAGEAEFFMTPLADIIRGYVKAEELLDSLVAA